MDTGRKIMNLRLDLGVTQRDLAKTCGITPGALSKIETGANNPSAAVLLRLAQALDTATDYLLDDAAPYPPPRPSRESKAGEADATERVTARITRQELWLLEDLRKQGAYWSEAALAIPAARVDTIRLVRYLLQRDQLEGAREAEQAAKLAAQQRKEPRKKGGVARRPRAQQPGADGP